MSTATATATATATKILSFLLPAIEAHKLRRFMCAPETTLYPDDRFMDWAEKIVYGNQEVCVSFIKEATNEDMTSLFGALGDDLWPAHRRAFASKLFQLATEVDMSGMDASKAFAEFYRERYNPSYFFHVEQPTIPVGSPVPKLDKVNEEHEDHEDEE